MLTSDATNCKALYRQGQAYLEMGELVKARECYEKILEIARSNPLWASSEDAAVQQLAEIKNKEIEQRDKELLS